MHQTWTQPSISECSLHVDLQHAQPVPSRELTSDENIIGSLESSPSSDTLLG
jgi:hypothetical protein